MLRNAGCFCESKTGNLHASCTFTIKEIVSVRDIADKKSPPQLLQRYQYCGERSV